MKVLSLEEQRAEYSQRRFLAMPLAGAIIWTIVGIAGAKLSIQATTWVLYIGTGSIVYLGMFLSRFTGENFMDKSKPKNTFDNLFFMTTAMALVVFTIAIPFALIEPTSLPLSIGILTGLMWLPLSWTIQHWVGIFHCASRSILVLASWYLFPQNRFIIIPVVIVVIYLTTIFILENRWKNLNSLKENS